MLSRRRFLKAVAGSAGLAAATGFYSWRVEPRWVDWVERQLPIANLPSTLNGKTLVQISDIHVNKLFDWRPLIEPFEHVEALKPDFVVYTGDFISYDSAEQVSDLAQLLQSAPLGTLGTAAVLGNHDYGERWQQAEVADTVASTIEAADIRVLRNEVEAFAGLTIAGIDDYWGTNFSAETTQSLIADHHPHITLCHNPDVCDLPVWGNYGGWVLAGHTHGGQIKPPFLPPPYVPVRNRAYTAGEYSFEQGRHLYINRGISHKWPLRFNVRPEVTLFTLERL